jgi:cell wall-associated NlpC family hydrolase
LLAALTAFSVLVPAAPADAAGLRSISPALAAVAGRALDASHALDTLGSTRNATSYMVMYDRYSALRDQAADLAASELDIPTAVLRDAWSLTDLDKQTAVLAALTQLGVAYRTNSSEPGVGFDCSGLTTYAWGVAGYELARQSRTQINDSTRIERQAAEAGDLMYYPGHVMMFLGFGDAMVHSPQRGSEVEITFLSERHSRRVVFADPTL